MVLSPKLRLNPSKYLLRMDEYSESSAYSGTHLVIAGTHKGKSGIVRDINTGKTGAVTVTVVEANGDRFKTLAKNLVAKT